MTPVAGMFYTFEDMTKEYSWSNNERVRDYLHSLLGYSVPDAMRGLSNFYNANKYGNHVYAVCEYIRSFHDCTFGIYARYDAIDDVDCVINQMVAIKNDMVYDIGNAIKYKETDIYTKFCRIPIYEYPGRHMVIGEELIQLPNPFYSKDITFYNYLMNNPGKKVIARVKG